MCHSKRKISSVEPRKYDIRRSFTALFLAAAIFSPPILSSAGTNLHSVVLNIKGNFEDKKNKGQKSEVIELDLESLTKLKSTTFTTYQPWTDKPKQYTGVRVSTLLDHIGAGSSAFEAMASNEYKFFLSDIDFERYPIIFAYKIDGEFLNARTLGPLLIVFPFDDYPELLNEKNKAASVWQLTEIRIR